MFDADSCDVCQLIGGGDGPTRIARGVDDDGARAVGDGRLDVRRIQMHAMFRLQRHRNRLATAHDDGSRVGREIR